jgi:hypothetical protein
MNLFHAVQYFGLVWWSEERMLTRRLSKPTAALLFVGLTLAYGTVAEILSDDSRILWSIAQTVALMHFFYDGFIWSVRKKQI